MRGFKFHPNTQAFWPNDRDHYPLYEVIAEAGLIALFHSGTTGIGAGMPGGGGVKLKYSNPMLVDDVAADFPELEIILAHPSFPWQDEALAIAVHKPNVYIDLSGWAPKYFPENLIRYTNTQLKRKMLFGSDFPLITPDRWLSEFERLPIKDEVRPLVLKENAARLFKLERARVIGDVLWSPPADLADTTEIGRFMSWLATERGRELGSLRRAVALVGRRPRGLLGRDRGVLRDPVPGAVRARAGGTHDARGAVVSRARG